MSDHKYMSTATPAIIRCKVCGREIVYISISGRLCNTCEREYNMIIHEIERLNKLLKRYE